MLNHTIQRTKTAKQMDQKQREELALQALRQDKPITQLSEENNVSRSFIHRQKNKAAQAVSDVFEPKNKDDDVLFYLPVTKTFIRKSVLSLQFNCTGSFRGVQKTLEELFDYGISIGAIHNIVADATNKAIAINSREDLSGIKEASYDELFHLQSPILSCIDLRSLFCPLLSPENNRDEITWGVNLLDLQAQGFNPDRIVADNGSGLRAGHQLVYPNTPCDGDNFHLCKNLQDLRRFFRNRLKTAISHYDNITTKLAKSKGTKKEKKYQQKLYSAKKALSKMKYLSEIIDILVEWMHHDVLNKAGTTLAVREELYDFISEEFYKLSTIHPHRIKEIYVTLKNQRDLFLRFVDVLNEKFQVIATNFACSLVDIWKFCELQRCEHFSDNYAVRSAPLQVQFLETFEEIEDAVMEAMDSTERTSSLLENLNGRVRTFIYSRKEIGFHYTELLRFYLNHTKFLRSTKDYRRGKTPAEILNGKAHPNWLDMLEAEPLKQAA